MKLGTGPSRSLAVTSGLLARSLVVPLAALAVACGGDEQRPAGAADGTGGVGGSSAGSGGSGNAAAGGSGGGVGGSGGGGVAQCLPAAEPFGADPAAGESFPDLEVARCDGSRLTLDEFRCAGEVTLFSIGAGWCEPCIEETPLLQEVQDALEADGVQVVQILFQDALSMPATTLFCENWVADAGNNWPSGFELRLPVTIDPAGNTLGFFDVAVTPLNLLVDRDGKVLWAETGQIPADLESTIRGFL